MAAIILESAGLKGARIEGLKAVRSLWAPDAPLKCSSADRYQAKRAPRCNGGNPCVTCRLKWQAAGLKPEGR